jgi:crossover junction endodeoxyribonuclease RusA
MPHPAAAKETPTQVTGRAAGPESPIAFEVMGRPAPQGSMRSPRAGVVLHSSSRLRTWRQAIGWAARGAYRGPPWAGPVQLELTFSFRPPKRAGANYPQLKATKPDLDKLVRACLDALTGIVWLDDAQVYAIDARKLQSSDSPEGVGVLIWLQSEMPPGKGRGLAQ